MGSRAPIKASRLRRVHEIETIKREASQIYEEFEQYRNARKRLAKKARQLANRVQKSVPDMRVFDDVSLHEEIDYLAKVLHLPNNHFSPPEGSTFEADKQFQNLFDVLKELAATTHWLDPLGGEKDEPDAAE